MLFPAFIAEHSSRLRRCPGCRTCPHWSGPGRKAGLLRMRRRCPSPHCARRLRRTCCACRRSMRIPRRGWCNPHGPIADLWQAHQAPEPDLSALAWRPQNVLLTRPQVLSVAAPARCARREDSPPPCIARRDDRGPRQELRSPGADIGALARTTVPRWIRPGDSHMNALTRPFALLDQFSPRLAPLAQLALRFALAVPFFRSGLTRNGRASATFRTARSTCSAEEFRLHLFGAQVPYPGADAVRACRRHRGAAAARCCWCSACSRALQRWDCSLMTCHHPADDSGWLGQLPPALGCDGAGAAGPRRRTAVCRPVSRRAPMI